MYDEWDNEYESNEEESGLWVTIRRILYIFIIFLIIMGLLSPSIRHIFTGERLGNSQSLPADPMPTSVSEQTERDVATATPDDSDSEAVVESTVGSATAEPVATEAVEEDASINRIAFITNDGQVGTISPDGSNRLIHTIGNSQFQIPTWSPDGQYVASIATTGPEGSIFLVKDDQTAEPRQIYASTSEPPFYLYWAPDSQAISFLAENDASPMALHLVGVNDTVADGSQKLAEGGPFYWDWLDDSQRMFIHSGVTGSEARLGFISPEGLPLGKDVAEPGAFQAPDISTNGRFLAYAAISRSGFSEIVIHDLETEEIFTQRHNGLASLSWSPTQNLLAYTNPPQPEFSTFAGPLRVLNAETGESKLLTNDAVLAYFWSPDGNSLAYFTLAGQSSDDFQASYDGFAEGKRLFSAKVAQQFNLPEFELTIVNVETGEGRIVLTDFTPSITFITQFLPYFDQYALSHSLWSPASDAMLVPFLDNGFPRILLVPANGGAARVLTDGNMAFWSHQ